MNSIIFHVDKNVYNTRVQDYKDTLKNQKQFQLSPAEL